MRDLDIFFGLLAFGLLIMCVGMWTSAIMGGWSQLAKQFPREQPVIGTKWWVNSIVLRKFFPTNYNNCVIIVANEQGLGLSMWFMFRVGHPPLFIPWSAMLISERQRYWFFKFAHLDFPDVPSVSIELPMKLAKKIEQAVGHDWFSDDGAEPESPATR